MVNLYQRLMMRQLTPQAVAAGAFNTSGFTPPQVARGNAQAMLSRAAIARGIVNAPLAMKYVLGANVGSMSGLSGFGALAGGGRFEVFGPFQFSKTETSDAWRQWAEANIPLILDGAALRVTALYQAWQGGNTSAGGQFQLLAGEVQREQQNADAAQERAEEVQRSINAFATQSGATKAMASQLQSSVDTHIARRNAAFKALGALAKRANNIVLAAPGNIETKDLTAGTAAPSGGNPVDWGKIQSRFNKVISQGARDAESADLREEWARLEAEKRAQAALSQDGTLATGGPSMGLILGGLVVLGGVAYFLTRKRG